MTRYTVIPSRRYVRDDGMTASAFGACPWTSEAERPRWTLTTVGWTVRNERNGTIGIGRQPWTAEAEAQAWADTANARHAAIATR